MEVTTHSDGKHPHGGMLAVLRTLEEVARMPDFNQLELSEVFRMENWNAFQNVYGDDEDPFANNDRQVVNAAWATRLKESTNEIDCVTKTLEALLNVAYELQSRLESSQKQIIAANLSKGVKSLPDEILAKVFQIAVWWEEDVFFAYSIFARGTRQAVWLSQVSRRFREVALGTRGLWTTLTSFCSKRQLEAFISRVGPVERFHVSLHISHSSEDRAFFEVCRPTISRWATLTLKHDSQFGYGARYGGCNDRLEKLFSLFSEGGVQFPMLEELIILGDRSDPRFGGLLPAAIEAWAPNLHTLRCPYFLPSLPNPFPSISTLIISHPISLDHFSSPMRMLLDLLVKLPNLSSFELELDDAHRWGEYEMLPVTECSSITSFELRIRDMFMLEFLAEGSCIAELMKAARMPSLEKFCILINPVGLGYSESECMEWSRWTGVLSQALFPDHFLKSTRISSVHYKMLYDSSDYKLTDGESKIPLDAREVQIPLNRILHVPTMVLSSFIPILFTQDIDGEDGHTYINGRRLTELKLIGCENMTSAHLKRTVESLELLGAWDDIKWVVVQECEHLKFEDVIDVVGEQRLQTFC
ncbi:hypothetical protein SCHPADRAFT_946583 [Schizopora paradoxa]|uniref:Uncharacterized protein n=1 Tax=Schizopora paradoxa TaxID=27342 RepID=A0A0H2R215_9AGAM|nr:hypothetical protein SCHPADRAFT_946583 [Schizopora paradoxa]